MGHHVIVDEQQVLSSRLCGSKVSGAGWAGAPRYQDSHGVAGLIACQRLRRPVLGAVVNHDHLEGRRLHLSGEGVQAASQAFAAVVGGYDHT